MPGFAEGRDSIDHRHGHLQVRIERERHEQLETYFLALARCWSASVLAEEFGAVPYEHDAPVRGQLRCIRRAVNQVRKEAGYELVPRDAVRWQGWIVRPFG